MGLWLCSIVLNVPECAYCPWTLHFNMVPRITFILCVYYHNFNKMKKMQLLSTFCSCKGTSLFRKFDCPRYDCFLCDFLRSHISNLRPIVDSYHWITSLLATRKKGWAKDYFVEYLVLPKTLEIYKFERIKSLEAHKNGPILPETWALWGWTSKNHA